MNDSLFDRVQVERADLAQEINWLLQSETPVSGSYYDRRKVLLGSFPSGVYRLAVDLEGAKESWNQSGWFSAYLGEQYCFSHWVPLGRSFLFLPPDGEYRVFFTPVRWLPRVSVELFQFLGQWSERLRSIEAKIDGLQLEINQQIQEVLVGDGSVLNEFLQDIPEQITETFEVLLDAGETP